MAVSHWHANSTVLGIIYDRVQSHLEEVLSVSEGQQKRYCWIIEVMSSTLGNGNKLRTLILALQRT